MKFIYYIFLLLLGLSACSAYDEELLPSSPPLVVEGWIEENGSPVVIVTHALDLTQETDSIENVVEKWGRVSVFDGNTRYILTGSINKSYTPSFIFTTSHLKGKVGHTYRLLVETETDTVESYATMLPAPELLPLEAEKVEGSDSLYRVRARIEGYDSGGYYKFFSQSLKTEKRYYGSFMGTFTGQEYNPEEGVVITKGIHSGYEDEDLEQYYKSGDRVMVKICSLEPALYSFWKVYDENVMMSQNLFFKFDTNCPSNIEGAFGYWAAYGTYLRTVAIP